MREHYSEKGERSEPSLKRVGGIIRPPRRSRIGRKRHMGCDSYGTRGSRALIAGVVKQAPRKVAPARARTLYYTRRKRE